MQTPEEQLAAIEGLIDVAEGALASGDIVTVERTIGELEALMPGSSHLARMRAQLVARPCAAVSPDCTSTSRDVREIAWSLAIGSTLVGPN